MTNNTKKTPPPNKQVKEKKLDEYIREESPNLEKDNDGIRYEIEKEKNKRNWWLQALKALTSSSWSALLAILLCIGVVDNRLDLEKEINNIQESTELTSKEKIEYRLKIREQHSDQETDTIAPLITLVLGYYFGTRKDS